jgi:hypothetical protein
MVAAKKGATEQSFSGGGGLQSNQWSLRIRLKHEKSMDVDDEQTTLNVVTCNQINQYDNVTWYEWLF